MEAKQTPLIDLLESVPRDAVLVFEHDQFSSSLHPVGRLCHEAAAELRHLHAENEALLAEVERLRAEVERLAMALRRYGVHDQACVAMDNPNCTCGLDAAMRKENSND